MEDIKFNIIEDGICIYHRYTLNGELHNLNGPAEICYYIINNKKFLRRKSFYVNGKLHRIDEPANIRFYNDEIVLEEYVVNGKCHRINGPAVIYYEDKIVVKKKYVLNDIRLNEINSDEDLSKYIKRLNLT